MSEAHAHGAGMQCARQMLFGDPLPDLDYETGYRGPIACHAAGITYQQLGYWDRTGLISPLIHNAHDSGSQRLYSFRDILVLKIVKRLLDTGVSLQQIRLAVAQLESHGVEDLAQITLMSDGASVYEYTSDGEVINLVKGGQGIFGVAVDHVWHEVEGTLDELPTERVEEAGAVAMEDELAKRRVTKKRRA